MKYFILAGALCLMAGCGGSKGTGVTGKVTFADGSPLTKGTVVYSGKTGTFQSAIKPDGTYTLDKVLEGDYRVAITGAQEGGGGPSEMKYDDKGNYIAPPPVTITPLIKSTFEDPEKSGLSKKVPGDYNIKVEKPE